MNEPLAIQTQGLTKSYGKVQALRGVDLDVRRGEIFGFLGPNGSGKTTTIRCLLDLIRPDGGALRVLGRDPQRESIAVRAHIGYLPGELRIDESFTVEAALHLGQRVELLRRVGAAEGDAAPGGADPVQLDQRIQ